MPQLTRYGMRAEMPLPLVFGIGGMGRGSALRPFRVALEESVAVCVRLGHLTTVFVPLLLVGLPLWMAGVVEDAVLWRWMRCSLGVAGGAFLKLGQWASTRPDILPVGLCEALAALQSEAPVHTMQWNRRVIQESFGCEMEELFAVFSETPLGSGTVAQVHRAQLHNGIPVAVKICHPDVAGAIERDLFLLGSVARAADWLFPEWRWLSLPAEVAAFSSMMRAQLDLRFEARTLHRFARNFAATARSWGFPQRTLFPEPCYPLVARRCLVEDLVMDAVPMQWFISEMHGRGHGSENENTRRDADLRQCLQKTREEVQEDLAVLGLQSFLQMLLWDNFVHADLHPGNILVGFKQASPHDAPPFVGGRGILHAAAQTVWSIGRRCMNLAESGGRFVRWRLLNPGPLPLPLRPLQCLEGRGQNETLHTYINRQLELVAAGRLLPVLVFIDAGLVASLSRPDFRNFADLFLALVHRGDGAAAGRLMVERSPEWAQQQVRDIDGFCRGMAAVVAPFLGRTREHSSRFIHHPTSLSSLSIGPVLEDVFSLVRRHRVRLDPAFTNLVMSLVCVEGLGRQLAPEVDLRPLLVQAAVQFLVTGRGWS